MISDFFDWRGGYCKDIPSELMAKNELLQAENCYWDNGLIKRGGVTQWAQASGNAIRGGIRHWIDGTTYFTLAVGASNGSAVYFVRGGAATYTEITMASGTSYTWNYDENVEFAVIGNNVIAVNGVDRPAIIYWESSSTWYIQDLDRHDTRTRDNDNWYAGIVDGSANYTDDTLGAQSSSSNDFQIASSTGTSGFWVACDLTYSHLKIIDAESMTGSFSVDYQYWNGSAWASFQTLNNSPTWTTTGDKELEFELPLDSKGLLVWQKYNDGIAGTVNDSISGRYPVRVMFDGNTNTPSAGEIEVKHTHYLTEILGDSRPQAVAVHKNHVFLAAGMEVQIGVANKVTDWRADRFEVFREGGDTVTQMISHQDYLAVLKQDVLYALHGNSWLNWSVRRIAKRGSLCKRSAVVAKDILFFVSRTGIYSWDGEVLDNVSKHVVSDVYDSSMSNIASVNYRGNVIMVFPTQQAAYWFDPDTMRNDLMGDKRVSVYRWTNMLVSGFLSEDDYRYNFTLLGRGLFGIDNTVSPPRLVTMDSVDTTDADGSAITMIAQSKYFTFKSTGVEKMSTRIKPRVRDSIIESGRTYNLKFMKNDEYGGASAAATITTGSGVGYHQEELMIPYTIDGRNLSLYIEHDATTSAAFYGFSVETRKRRF